jgi:Tol biopolymer transport system component
VITLILSAMSQSASAQDLSAFDTGSDNQLGLTFTPDGSTAFWVAWNGNWGSNQASQRVIYTSQQQDGVWSTPTPAEFSGHHSDSDPFATPDGQWLYFVSDRPTNDDDESLDTNIWRYSLIERNLLEYISINSSSREYSPVVTASGALYFASDREGGPGQGDLYRAAPNGSGYLPPQPLGPAFNTPTGEWNLWVSADEDEIIFEASSRPTNVSASGDLYYSWRTPAGWTDATPLEGVNSQNSDLMPRLHPDGETLYFTTAPFGGHAQIATEEWTQMRTRARTSYAPIR